MLTDLVQLRTFVIVAEEEHLTRASERLNMSQSAASAHVRAVEERLGTELFLRTNRNLELTPIGRLVAQRARELLNQEAMFTSFTRELQGKVEGRLVVGTSSAPGTRVGEILLNLLRQNPLIRVDTIARPSSGARQGLMSGEMDVGVLLCIPIEPSFTYHKLDNVEYRVAGPVAWKQTIETAGWMALAELPWLTPSASSAYSAMLAQLFGNRGLELNSVMRFDNSAVGRAALMAGVGMMLLRADEALEGEREGRLAISPLARARVELSIAYQTSRREDPLIKAFVAAAQTVWPLSQLRLQAEELKLQAS